MTDDKALTKPSITAGSLGLQLKTFDDFQRFAAIAVAAGIVGKKESPQEAIAKAVIAIQYGAEIGLPPLSSLTNVYVINGRPSLSPAMMAARLVEKGYQYRIIEHSETICAIAFANARGVDLGVSTFTIDDAKKAGLTDGNNAHSWRKFARNMLFARAIANGARWYCPDVMIGNAYTDEEIVEMEAPSSLPASPTKKDDFKNLKELIAAKASEFDPFDTATPTQIENTIESSSDGKGFEL